MLKRKQKDTLLYVFLCGYIVVLFSKSTKADVLEELHRNLKQSAAQGWFQIKQAVGSIKSQIEPAETQTGSSKNNADPVNQQSQNTSRKSTQSPQAPQSKTAKQNQSIGSDTKSLYLKGIKYLKSKNYQLALDFLQKASLRSYPKATYHLGVMYEKGLGVKRSPKRAIALYQKAAQKGLSAAKYNLACLLSKEDGKNIPKALKLFQEVAKTGDKDAIYNLGVLYKEAIVDEENEIKAYRYLKKAKRLGHPMAAQKLKELCSDSPWACR